MFDARFYDPKKAVTIDPEPARIVPNSGDIYNGMVIPGSTASPMRVRDAFPAPAIRRSSLSMACPRPTPTGKKNNFVPRLGVAYQINP